MYHVSCQPPKPAKETKRGYDQARQIASHGSTIPVAGGQDLRSASATDSPSWTASFCTAGTVNCTWISRADVGTVERAPEIDYPTLHPDLFRVYTKDLAFYPISPDDVILENEKSFIHCYQNKYAVSTRIRKI